MDQYSSMMFNGRGRATICCLGGPSRGSIDDFSIDDLYSYKNGKTGIYRHSELENGAVIDDFPPMVMFQFAGCVKPVGVVFIAVFSTVYNGV